jgi:hypothetical protein
MSQSLQEIKDQLTALGLSTLTPGAKGDLRREELLNRLEEALLKSGSAQSGSEQARPIERKSDGGSYTVPSLVDLSMAEIRSRLTLLGEVC